METHENDFSLKTHKCVYKVKFSVFDSDVYPNNKHRWIIFIQPNNNSKLSGISIIEDQLLKLSGNMKRGDIMVFLNKLDSLL
jgi:hypothetical protein